ncbi:hypothetical protein FS837_008638 [Tulasnella sp. UAMH 9824]|nr:hypothetical protein FS837_008638 [Tulasnella sp. UAMH 9824]
MEIAAFKSPIGTRSFHLAARSSVFASHFSLIPLLSFTLNSAAYSRNAIHILLELVAMSIAVPSSVEPGVELLPKLRPKTKRRQVAVIEGIWSRDIGGGFVAVLPEDNAIPAESDGGSNSRRRFLRKDEIVVPQSLQEPSSKRAVYHCTYSGYGLVESYYELDSIFHYVVEEILTVENSQPWTFQVEIAASTEKHAAGRVNIGVARRDAAETQPGYTCYRDSVGTRLCRAPGSNNDHTTTTKRTTTTITTAALDVAQPTTLKLPKGTTTTDVQDTATTDAQDTTATDAQVQATDTTSLTFPMTTPTPAPASNTTSSASRTSSTLDVPIVAADGAMAVSFREGCLFLMATLLLALGHALVVV